MLDEECSEREAHVMQTWERCVCETRAAGGCTILTVGETSAFFGEALCVCERVRIQYTDLVLIVERNLHFAIHLN